MRAGGKSHLGCFERRHILRRNVRTQINTCRPHCRVLFPRTYTVRSELALRSAFFSCVENVTPHKWAVTQRMCTYNGTSGFVRSCKKNGSLSCALEGHCKIGARCYDLPLRLVGKSIKLAGSKHDADDLLVYSL